MVVMSGLSCARCREQITKQQDAMVVANRLRGPMLYHGHCTDMNATAKPAVEAGSFAGAYLIWLVVSVIGIAYLLPQFLFRGQEEVLIPVGVLTLSLVIHVLFIIRLFSIRGGARSLQ